MTSFVLHLLNLCAFLYDYYVTIKFILMRCSWSNYAAVTLCLESFESLLPGADKLLVLLTDKDEDSCTYVKTQENVIVHYYCI